MNKSILKKYSKKCPYKLGDSVTVPYLHIPMVKLANLDKMVKNQKITDIEIIQSKQSEKVTFVYQLENSKKYYRLKKSPGKKGSTINKKVRISLKTCKLWPYFPDYQECS